MKDPAKTPRETLQTLLERARAGDENAMQRVFSVVYPDLRRLARHYMRQERAGHTLQPTDLVNEVFLKVAAGKSVEWQSRAQLVAVMARQMRWILVDHARRRKALKRGDTLIPLTLSKEAAQKQPRLENILAINEALEDLERLDKRTAQVVELRVFGLGCRPEPFGLRRRRVWWWRVRWRVWRMWRLRRLRPWMSRCSQQML